MMAAIIKFFELFVLKKIVHRGGTHLNCFKHCSKMAIVKKWVLCIVARNSFSFHEKPGKCITQ